MKRPEKQLALFACLGMAILILDGKTAVYGAREGIRLVLETVIPSLFPFFFLSILITGTLCGSSFSLIRFLSTVFHIPIGTESVLLSAFLGGYPTGAQAVYSAYKTGSLSKSDAEQMLAFCNNAGPAFLFGMVSAFFPDFAAVWKIWGILFVSAAAVSQIFPCTQKHSAQIHQSSGITPVAALKSAVTVTSQVCGWVILFRIILSFFQRWFLWLLPTEPQTAIIGFLEISNGCCFLSEIGDLRLRFVLCCGMLSFGGLCVAMQTGSVIKELSMKNYWTGKLLQTVLSVALAWTTAYHQPSPLAACLLFYGYLLVQKKKRSSIPIPAGV